MYTTGRSVTLNGRVSLVRALSAGRQRVVFAPLFFQITVLHDAGHVLEQRLESTTDQLFINAHNGSVFRHVMTFYPVV